MPKFTTHCSSLSRILKSQIIFAIQNPKLKTFQNKKVNRNIWCQTNLKKEAKVLEKVQKSWIVEKCKFSFEKIQWKKSKHTKPIVKNKKNPKSLRRQQTDDLQKPNNYNYACTHFPLLFVCRFRNHKKRINVLNMKNARN